MWALGAAALALAWPGSQVFAQAVRLTGARHAEPEVRTRIQAVLSARGYEVWVSDTVLAAGDSVQGDVVLLRATARVSGTIAGTILAVESEVFVRPGADVRGGAVVLNGGYYGTHLATVGPVLHRPIADYRVQPESEGGGYRIVPPRGQPALELMGVSGLLPPTYERVSALTVPWGLRYQPGVSAWAPEAWAVVRYRTARERADGEVHLSWEGATLSLDLSGGRATESQDAWIGEELENTLGSFFFGADHRDYYDAKFARLRVAARHGVATRLRHGVRVEWEEAESLANEDPFSVFETEEFRPNPAIAEGTAVDLRVDSELETTLGRSGLRLGGFWEIADGNVAGDFTYARVGAELAWLAPTFWEGHALRVRALAGGPLAGAVPPQRWIGLGGFRTLPTIPDLSLRGDTYLFVQSTYFWTLASTGLGDVRLWLQHMTGSAWISAQPPLEQNLGLGLDVGPIAVWVFGDPSESDGNLELGFGLREF